MSGRASSITTSRLPRTAASIAAVLAVATLAPVGVAVAASAPKRDAFGFFDSRRSTAHAQKVLRARAARREAAPSDAASALRGSLGVRGRLSLDPLTGTPRFVGRTDGFLTGPSTASPADVAREYVAAHAVALGLEDGAGSLRLARDYVDIGGTHHLGWMQVVDGIALFGNGLQASVSADGRLINVTGSPVAGPQATSTSPSVSAARAIAVAQADARAAVAPQAGRQQPAFAEGERSRVLFETVDGIRLAWRMTLSSSVDSFVTLVDAETGRVLYRRSLVEHASALAFDNYPGAAHGGEQHAIDLNGRGWLGDGAERLSGNNAHVYTDVDADNRADAGEEVGPDDSGNWDYGPVATFNDQPGCSGAYPCTWNADLATGGFSWQTNRKQAATQAFVFANTFHDHLLASPIGFTEAAGNFQLVNHSGAGHDGDAVDVEALDGANTLRVDGALVGLPDPGHVDNANMRTPVDGLPGRMQLYLGHDPSDPSDPFIAANGADDADIVYHEYTHGLSGRLVVDAEGNSTLMSLPARSMGEGWSDWYALDYQVSEGLDIDTPADGELRLNDYLTHGQDLTRLQPLDCSVGSTSPKCQAGTQPFSDAGPGGFTFGDYGKILPYPEPHADGEIWVETLWDLRTALGSRVTEAIVTRAMELSAPDPTFLDMRNAILQADLVNFSALHSDAIWRVFAHRGMGWYAAVLDADDLEPSEDFHVPPAGAERGKLLGKVIDRDTGKPVEGIRVAFGGHSSGLTSDLAGLTKKNGVYDIKQIYAGSYPKVFAGDAGYDRVVIPSVTIAGGETATVLNWTVRRDWASIFGGATIASLTGPDYSAFNCGPDHAIDQSLTHGWASDSVDSGGEHFTPQITIALPQRVDITQFAIDPAETCGDDFTASTKGYRIETSPDAATWTVAREGTFGDEDRGHLNHVTPSAGATGVRYVRFTMLTQQLVFDCAEEPRQGGCQFTDMSEIEIYGRPS